MTVLKWLLPYSTEATYIFILDIVVICVLWAWADLANIFMLGQVLDEHFGLVIPLCDWEGEAACILLNRQWQFSERRVSLLRVQRLCQRSQI